MILLGFSLFVAFLPLICGRYVAVNLLFGCCYLAVNSAVFSSLKPSISGTWSLIRFSENFPVARRQRRSGSIRISSCTQRRGTERLATRVAGNCDAVSQFHSFTVSSLPRRLPSVREGRQGFAIEGRHCEERSDEAISAGRRDQRREIASLRSQ
jgi:hypothetical protein